MSLSRAFTSRRAKASHDFDENVKRSYTLSKGSSQRHLRHQISAPVELVHTTNMLSYNAPDIRKRRPSQNNTGPTRIAEEDSDTLTDSGSTPPTSPESEPFENCGPEPNHLSTYFMASPVVGDPPAIPRRSPSHTKQNSFDALARQRSTSRLSKGSHSSYPSLSFSRSSSTSTSASSTARSSDSHSPQQMSLPIPPPLVTSKSAASLQAPSCKSATSPVGRELPQVAEISEDLTSGRLEVIHEDELYLSTRGLARMTADDYLNEIHSVMASFWPETNGAPPLRPLWI